ncbi:hypothetical protein RCL1_003315 [Eukaryota sp. TZLM3-RCL]
MRFFTKNDEGKDVVTPAGLVIAALGQCCTLLIPLLDNYEALASIFWISMVVLWESWLAYYYGYLQDFSKRVYLALQLVTTLISYASAIICSALIISNDHSHSLTTLVHSVMILIWAISLIYLFGSFSRRLQHHSELRRLSKWLIGSCIFIHKFVVGAIFFHKMNQSQ